jgi:hypothetical protein
MMKQLLYADDSSTYVALACRAAQEEGKGEEDVIERFRGSAKFRRARVKLRRARAEEGTRG